METFCMIPNILHNKLINNDELKDMFKPVPSACYNHMITEIVSTLYYKDNLSNQVKSRISKSHAKFNITKHQFNVFINLFFESMTEAGLKEGEVSKVHQGLLNLSEIFIFTEDDLKTRTLKSINEIINDIEIYSDYDDVCNTLKTVKATLNNTRRSIDLNKGTE